MNNNLNKNLLERYSRQIVLKDIGVIGQKKISNSKVLIVGAGISGIGAGYYLKNKCPNKNINEPNSGGVSFH